jgi:DNA-binding HxlR family transcriptional regulator
MLVDYKLLEQKVDSSQRSSRTSYSLTEKAEPVLSVIEQFEAESDGVYR